MLRVFVIYRRFFPYVERGLCIFRNRRPDCVKSRYWERVNCSSSVQ